MRVRGAVGNSLGRRGQARDTVLVAAECSSSPLRCVATPRAPAAAVLSGRVRACAGATTTVWRSGRSYAAGTRVPSARSCSCHKPLPWCASRARAVPSSSGASVRTAPRVRGASGASLGSLRGRGARGCREWTGELASVSSALRQSQRAPRAQPDPAASSAAHAARYRVRHDAVAFRLLRTALEPRCADSALRARDGGTRRAADAATRLAREARGAASPGCGGPVRRDGECCRQHDRAQSSGAR